MDFALFILLNAILFIRPSDIVPDLAAVPVYEIVILLCIAVSLPKIVAQLSLKSLQSRPISLFVVGLWFAVVFSQLIGRFYITAAKDAGIEFAKIIIYYLLLMSVVNTSLRLRQFLAALCILVAVVCGLAVLHYHSVISVPGMRSIEQGGIDRVTGQYITVRRMQGTGVFGDPNDLSLLAVLGIVCSAYGMAVPAWRPYLPLWIGGIGLFLYALAQTQSRGGLLALLIAGTALFQSRYGWKKAIPLLACVGPLVLLLFSGRQTGLGQAISHDTGQQRVQIWAEGLATLRQHPVFGIGYEQLMENGRPVSHNSFIHAYTELGLFGGTLFFGAFAYAIWAIHQVGRKNNTYILHPRLARMRPFLIAIVAGYAGGMLSLSRNYIVPTYLILGLAAVYLHLIQKDNPLPQLRFSPRLVRRLAFASVAFLACTYMFVRVFARWGG